MSRLRQRELERGHEPDGETIVAAEVLVIGAGPGGLATSMLLSHAGYKVKLIERQPHVGGRTSSIKREGYTFDCGPTFFLYPRILREIFEQTGFDLDSEVEMQRLDPQYRLVFGGGGTLDCTPNVEKMKAELARFSPGSENGLEPFLNENREKLDCFSSVLESPFYKLTDVLRPDVLRAAPLLRPWRSLHSEISRHFADPRLQLAFTFQGKYVGMSPFQCPSLFSILAFLEYEHGVFHPTGGCGQVSQTMAKLAERLGTEIHLNESVEEILFEGRKAVGVRTDKATYRSDAIVINADFAHAMTRMVPNHLRRRWTDQKLAKKKYSCSTFMLYLGVEGLQNEVAHHTIYLSADYQQNLRDIERHHCLSEDPSVYVQNAGVTDSTLAPDGHSTLYVLAPVSHMHDNINWQTEAPAFREKVLDQLEKIGIRDVRARIRSELMITPADWQNQHHVYNGATFNLSHNLGQMLYFRPHNRFEDVDQVYLVGGGTHPGSGLPVIYSSARISTQTLMEDLSSRGLGPLPEQVPSKLIQEKRVA